MTTHNTPDKQGEALVAHEIAAIKRRMLYLQSTGASDCGLTPWSVLRLITTIETDRSRASVAAPEGDAHNRAVQLVDRWAIDRRLAPPQRYPVQQDFRILKEWIARALTDYAAASPPAPPHDGFHPAEDVYEATKEFWPAEPLQPTGEQELK